jgi:predicted esterase
MPVFLVVLFINLLVHNLVSTNGAIVERETYQFPSMFWPESLGIPLLIMHGGADRSVNPSQSLTIAQKLQSLGETYELIIYAGDGHRLSRNQEERDRRAVAWFRKHMKPKL